LSRLVLTKDEGDLLPTWTTSSWVPGAPDILSLDKY
jgi:hypothetical protein